MNPKRLAQALNTLSVGFAELAEALNELPPLDEALPSFANESVDFAETPSVVQAVKEGSLEQCPKHRKPYKDGRYGPFCTSTSDDPKWSNDKGYCTITPKSAAAWLRQQAAVTA